MSTPLPQHWAEKAAVADVYERVILLVLAAHANRDGTNAYPSHETLAESALCDAETVKRRMASMRKRRLIARGDQSQVAHIRKDKRPVVHDVLIPRSWYSDEQWDALQEERARRGLESIDPGARPDIAPPAKRGRAVRSDKGVPNPKRSPNKQGMTSDNTTAVALPEPPQDDASEGSKKPASGALTELGGGSKRATTSSLDPHPVPPPLEDTEAVPEPRQEEEEGVEENDTQATAKALLKDSARFKPGKFLGDQARAECETLVEQHLAAGWNRDRLGQYVRDWSAQAHNPSTWLLQQLRSLGAPPRSKQPSAETSTKPSAASDRVPASAAHRAASKESAGVKKAHGMPGGRRNRPKIGRNRPYVPEQGESESRDPGRPGSAYADVYGQIA